MIKTAVSLVIIALILERRQSAPGTSARSIQKINGIYRIMYEGDEMTITDGFKLCSDAKPGPYVAISAGDGSFNSRLCPSLEVAIQFLKLDFEDDTGDAEIDKPWVEAFIRDVDEWSQHGVGKGELLWRGEQCHFMVIEIVEVPTAEVDRLRHLDKLAREWLRLEDQVMTYPMQFLGQVRLAQMAAVAAREAYRAAVEEAP